MAMATEVASAGVGSGSYLWTVPSTPNRHPEIRVSWNNGPASAVSPPFTILMPNIRFRARRVSPCRSGHREGKNVKFRHNLPAGILLTVQVSRDGGLWETLQSEPSTAKGQEPGSGS